MSKALNNFRDEMQPIIKSKEKTMVEIYSFFSVYIYIFFTSYGKTYSNLVSQKKKLFKFINCFEFFCYK